MDSVLFEKQSADLSKVLPAILFESELKSSSMGDEILEEEKACEIDEFRARGKRQNLDQPLSHYYIKGNYNTYSLGKEMTRENILESYRQALKANCKCLQLDLRDGPNGEVIVYHRRAPKIHITAQEILQDCIKPIFSDKDLPLILSIDDNIKSTQQRNILIYNIRTILKKFIYVEDVEGMSGFPSPNQLRGKIILQAPREKWGDLTNICQSTPPAYQPLEVYGDRLNWFEVSTLSKHKLDQYLTPTLAKKAREKTLRKFTTNNLIKNNPGSSKNHNFDPFPGMNVGCQIVAVDVETKAGHLAMYESKFRENGNSGYVLKPEPLLDPDAPFITAKRIDIIVIEGRNIPLTNNTGLTDTFVNVSIKGVKEDKTTHSTKKIRSDGRNPVYSEYRSNKPMWNTKGISRLKGANLSFNVGNPELTFLLLEVKKSENLGLKTSTVASYAIPVANLRRNCNTFPLYDKYLAPIEGAELDINVSIEEPPERKESETTTVPIYFRVVMDERLNFSPTGPGERPPKIVVLGVDETTSKRSIWWKSLVGNHKSPGVIFTTNSSHKNDSFFPPGNTARTTDELKKENVELRKKLSEFEIFKNSIEHEAWSSERREISARDPWFDIQQKSYMSELHANFDVLQDATEKAEKEFVKVRSALNEARAKLDSIEMLQKAKPVEEVNDLARIRKIKLDEMLLGLEPSAKIDFDAIDCLTGLPRGRYHTTQDKIEELERQNEELKLQLDELTELESLNQKNPTQFKEMLSSYSNARRSRVRYTWIQNKAKMREAIQVLQSTTLVAKIGLAAVTDATTTVGAQLKYNRKIFHKAAKNRDKK